MHDIYIYLFEKTVDFSYLFCIMLLFIEKNKVAKYKLIIDFYKEKVPNIFFYFMKVMNLIVFSLTQE